MCGRVGKINERLKSQNPMADALAINHMDNLQSAYGGAGIAQWLECRTRD